MAVLRRVRSTSCPNSHIPISGGPDTRLKVMRSAHLLLALILFILACPAQGSRDYLRVEEVTMRLEDDDAVFEVEFDLTTLARLYVLALGSKHIEPDLNRIFDGFDNLSMVKTEPDRAVLVARGAAEHRDRYCLFDSKPLGAEVPKLNVVYPEGNSHTYYDVSETPSVFCKAV